MIQELLSIIESGVVSTPVSAGGNSLTDSTKAWATDVHKNRVLRITDQQGLTQIGVVSANSRDSLIVRQAWLKAITAGSIYAIIDIDFMQCLRDVLNSGLDISLAHPLEVHDPKVGSLISYEGTTSAAGAGDGSTLICAALAALPDYDGNQVIVTSGACIGQARDINGTTAAGTVTAHLVFDAQIVAGVTFVIAAIRTVPAEVAALAVLVTALMADVGNPTGETIGNLADRFGDIARSLDLILGARWDGAGDLGTDIVAILAAAGGVTGAFREQVDAPINQAVAAVEVFVVTLNAATTRYILRDLRIKSADPTVANTITVRLYTLINDVETNVGSFVITNANFGTHFSLMDMFGVPHVAGDSIRVSLQGSAAGPYTVTGQYSHGKTNV